MGGEADQGRAINQQRKTPPMPRIKEPLQPFVPVEDAPIVATDPLLSRVFALFDGLRKRNVGPERASYTVAQVFGAAANGGSHPAPPTIKPLTK